MIFFFAFDRVGKEAIRKKLSSWVQLPDYQSIWNKKFVFKLLLSSIIKNSNTIRGGTMSALLLNVPLFYLNYIYLYYIYDMILQIVSLFYNGRTSESKVAVDYKRGEKQ